TARRLEEFRAGVTSERDPALFNIMAKVASKLTDEEIGALSSYLQGLHDRADDVAAAGAAGRQCTSATGRGRSKRGPSLITLRRPPRPASLLPPGAQPAPRGSPR